MQQTPQPLAGADRILVVRPDNIGDVILAGPVFGALRRHRPAATLGLLGSRAGRSAAPLLPAIDEVIEAQPAWQDLGGRLPLDPERELGLIRTIAEGGWDAAVILTSFRQTAWAPAYAAYLAGVPVRIGFAADFGGALLTHAIAPPPVEVHQGTRNERLLAAVGVAVEDGDFELAIPREAKASVAARLRDGGVRARPVVVVPGASAPARRMAPERYGAAAGRIASRTGRDIVVTGTSREAATLAATAQAARHATVFDDLSVPELAALIDESSLVLCGNSAALHIADALHRPVVSAYSGTDLPSQWVPRRAPSTLLTVPVDCSPCYRITCPIGNACLALDPDAIAEAGLALLESVREHGTAPRPTTTARQRDGGAACVH